jgi:hypothetical protein
MPRYSTEFLQTMRAALDEVMTRIPADQATSAVKAKVAEIILKTAAEGQTSYQGLISAASDQIHTIISAPTRRPKADMVGGDQTLCSLTHHVIHRVY